MKVNLDLSISSSLCRSSSIYNKSCEKRMNVDRNISTAKFNSIKNGSAYISFEKKSAGKSFLNSLNTDLQKSKLTSIDLPKLSQGRSLDEVVKKLVKYAKV